MENKQTKRIPLQGVKYVKCSSDKCFNVYAMPIDFVGKVTCENCDQFYKKNK